MKIRAVRKNIIFKFTDETLSTKFVNSSHAGILIAPSDNNQNTARWGQVVCVGEQVSDVAAEDFILIEKGKWTSSFTVDGKRFWKTDEDQVLAVSDRPYTTY